eukprot:39425-Eustigmatos_ZCMA.PRE.1
MHTDHHPDEDGMRDPRSRSRTATTHAHTQAHKDTHHDDVRYSYTQRMNDRQHLEERPRRVTINESSFMSP